MSDPVRVAPPAPQNETDVKATPVPRAIAPAPSRSALRAVVRGLVTLIFTAAGFNALSSALNEARDIVMHAPEPLPAVMLFQLAIGLLSIASAVGVWRRASWSHLTIAGWGSVGAVFVALLESLLKLGSESRAGLLGGAVTLLAIAAGLAWFAKRDHALFVTPPVHDRQKRM